MFQTNRRTETGRQTDTDRHTDRQTERQTYRQTKNCQGAGSTNYGADSACGLSASIARPTASLPLRPRNYGRGLVIYA